MKNSFLLIMSMTILNPNIVFADTAKKIHITLEPSDIHRSIRKIYSDISHKLSVYLQKHESSWTHYGIDRDEESTWSSLSVKTDHEEPYFTYENIVLRELICFSSMRMDSAYFHVSTYNDRKILIPVDSINLQLREVFLLDMMNALKLHHFNDIAVLSQNSYMLLTESLHIRELEIPSTTLTINAIQLIKDPELPESLKMLDLELKMLAPIMQLTLKSSSDNSDILCLSENFSTPEMKAFVHFCIALL